MSCEQLQTYPVTFSAGDTLPEMPFRYGLPLTGLTFTITLVQPDGTKVQRDHSTVDGDNGIGKFVWQTGDLVAGKKQVATVDLDNGSGGLQRVGRFFINVDEAE